MSPPALSRQPLAGLWRPACVMERRPGASWDLVSRRPSALPLLSWASELRFLSSKTTFPKGILAGSLSLRGHRQRLMCKPGTQGKDTSQLSGCRLRGGRRLVSCALVLCSPRDSCLHRKARSQGALGPAYRMSPPGAPGVEQGGGTVAESLVNARPSYRPSRTGMTHVVAVGAACRARCSFLTGGAFTVGLSGSRSLVMRMGVH